MRISQELIASESFSGDAPRLQFSFDARNAAYYSKQTWQTMQLKATSRFLIVWFNFQNQFSPSDSNKLHCSIWITPICSTFVDSWKSPQFSVLQPHCNRPIDKIDLRELHVHKKRTWNFFFPSSFLEGASNPTNLILTRQFFMTLIALSLFCFGLA